MRRWLYLLSVVSFLAGIAVALWIPTRCYVSTGTIHDIFYCRSRIGQRVVAAVAGAVVAVALGFASTRVRTRAGEGAAG